MQLIFYTFLSMAKTYAFVCLIFCIRNVFSDFDNGIQFRIKITCIYLKNNVKTIFVEINLDCQGRTYKNVTLTAYFPSYDEDFDGGLRDMQGQLLKTLQVIIPTQIIYQTRITRLKLVLFLYVRIFYTRCGFKIPIFNSCYIANSIAILIDVMLITIKDPHYKTNLTYTECPKKTYHVLFFYEMTILFLLN